jgi:hypothetical protein
VGGGEMEDGRDSPERPTQHLRIRHVSFQELEPARRLEVLHAVEMQVESDHLAAPNGLVGSQMASDEAAGAGDQHLSGMHVAPITHFGLVDTTDTA